MVAEANDCWCLVITSEQQVAAIIKFCDMFEYHRPVNQNSYLSPRPTLRHKFCLSILGFMLVLDMCCGIWGVYPALVA